jgi:hypothetical protein
MPGFFEKRVMADIKRQVRALWPGLNVSVVPSAYNPDGLCVRVRVTDEVYVDSTIFNKRWTAFIGADGDDFSIEPDPRLSQEYQLRIGAPASQVAPAIVDFVREAWPGLTTLKAKMIEISDGVRKPPATEATSSSDLDSAVAIAINLLRSARLTIECYTKPEEMELLVQVEELPDLFLAVRDGSWWARSDWSEETEPEAEFIPDGYAIAKLIAQCVIRRWLSVTADSEGVDYYRTSNAGYRHIQPCAHFFSTEELLAAIHAITSLPGQFNPVALTLTAVMTGRTA